MGTIASTNAGLANLMQTLTNAGSSLVSSPSQASSLQAELQNASPSDLVKLSDAALELQNVDLMFGGSDTSGANSLLSALESGTVGAQAAVSSSTPAAGTSASGSSPSGSPTTASQLAATESSLQSQETAALFGLNPDTTSSNSLFNLIG